MVLSEFVSALILAVVQGITEWLPISSSGHLVLFEDFLGFHGGLLFEVALHFGTLAAVFVYFGKDIIDIFEDLLKGKFESENGKLGLMLVIATIPAALVGFLARDFFDSVLSDLRVVAFGFAITGLLLMIASFSRKSFGKSVEGKLTFSKAAGIGIFQAFSIVPGISRSGATITSGVLFGLSERTAMKFAFLLSIPIIFGANILVIGNQTLSSDLIWATLVSFIVGLGTIHLMFNYVLVSRKNFRWFGAYALLLALGIGVFLLVG